MKYSIAVTVLMASIGFVHQAHASESSTHQAHAAEFIEGQDYRVVTKPDVIKSDAIIVREFFYYGCSHCYKLEPYIHKWEKTKPADVVFFASPAAVNPVWENSARGFYAAQMMGKQHSTHTKLYDSVFKDNNKAVVSKDKQAVINWYAAQGIDQSKFTNTLDSFAVNTKIARNKAAFGRYQLTGTPSVVVHGKYVINAAEPAKTIEILDFLVEKVRAEKK